MFNDDIKKSDQLVGNAKQDNEKCKEKQNKTNEKKNTVAITKNGMISGSLLRLSIERTGFKIFYLFRLLFELSTVETLTFHGAHAQWNRISKSSVFFWTAKNAEFQTMI